MIDAHRLSSISLGSLVLSCWMELEHDLACEYREVVSYEGSPYYPVSLRQATLDVGYAETPIILLAEADAWEIGVHVSITFDSATSTAFTMLDPISRRAAVYRELIDRLAPELDGLGEGDFDTEDPESTRQHFRDVAQALGQVLQACEEAA